MGNVIFEYLEERGEKRNQEATAHRMLDRGLDPLDIIKATGIDAERLREIRESVRGDKMLAT